MSALVFETKSISVKQKLTVSFKLLLSLYPTFRTLKK